MGQAREVESKRHSPRIYILPTRFGLIFLFGSCVMMLVGSIYQNNLVNMLAYFMLAIIFAGAILTQENLKGIVSEGTESDGGHAGGTVLITAVFGNHSAKPRFNLESRLRKIKAQKVYESPLALGPRSELKMAAVYPAGETRGRFSTRGVRLSSRYPLGLFEAWINEDVETTYFVYPRLKGLRRLPARTGPTDEGARGFKRAQSGQDFHGHRDFHMGESQRHIDWKARARGRPLLIKEFNEGNPGAIALDWRDTEGLEFEDRVSQLALWVDEARERKLSFSLHLPGEVINPGRGPKHARRCLEALSIIDDSATSSRRPDASP